MMSAVNLSLSPGVSMYEAFGSHDTSRSTPSKSSPAKRKRTEDKASLPSSTPEKGSNTRKDSTISKRIKKEPAPKHEQVQSSPMRTPGSRNNQEFGSPLPQTPHYASSTRLKAESYADNRSYPSSVLISGLYEIDCPTAGDMFGDYDINLTLSRNSSRGCWWATFRWGAWDGIILMKPGPDADQPTSFGWRLRDLEIGQLKSGKKCTGQMTCFSNQTLRGEQYEIPGVGTIEFEGTALEDDLQHEWDAFVSEAYGC